MGGPGGAVVARKHPGFTSRPLPHIAGRSGSLMMIHFGRKSNAVGTFCTVLQVSMYAVLRTDQEGGMWRLSVILFLFRILSCLGSWAVEVVRFLPCAYRREEYRQCSIWFLAARHQFSVVYARCWVSIQDLLREGDLGTKCSPHSMHSYATITGLLATAK